MRQASITMSWLAERNATSAAAAMEITGGRRLGWTAPARPRRSASAGWIASSQPRRRPRRRSGPGGGALVEHRRPQEFQRVGQPDIGGQPDGRQRHAAFRQPVSQRKARQRQRQAGRRSHTPPSATGGGRRSSKSKLRGGWTFRLTAPARRESTRGAMRRECDGTRRRDGGCGGRAVRPGRVSVGYAIRAAGRFDQGRRGCRRASLPPGLLRDAVAWRQAGKSASPRPSVRCIDTTSTQRPNLMPTARMVPTM